MIRLGVLLGALLAVLIALAGGASSALALTSTPWSWSQVTSETQSLAGDGCSVGDYFPEGTGATGQPDAPYAGASNTCLTPDEYTELQNELTSAGYESASATQFPSDIPSDQEQTGSSWWDSLESADPGVKGEGLDMLSEQGIFESFGAMPEVALGVGVFAMGFSVGHGIADLLGLNSSDGENGPSCGSTCPTQDVELNQAHLVAGGTRINVCGSGIGSCQSDQPGGAAYWSAPSPGYIINSAGFGGGGVFTEYQSGTGACTPVYVLDNAPQGAVLVDLDHGVSTCPFTDEQGVVHDPGAIDEFYFEPLEVQSLPGPGQGDFNPSNGGPDCTAIAPPGPTASTACYSGQPGTSPTESGIQTGSASELADPTSADLNESLCAMPANSFCSGVDHDAPTGLVIPAPQSDETYAHYLARLQALGITGTITDVTLSDEQADPSQGPDDVVRTSPASGTTVAASTDVSVYTNPDSSASTPPGGGPLPPPTLPGFSLPSVPTPCNVFPFGIPCWLANQLGSLAATPIAPAFSIGLPTSICGSNCALNVDLSDPFGADLSGIMAVVRPVLLFLSFAGLVLWLGGMAMGGSTGGGGGSDAESEA